MTQAQSTAQRLRWWLLALVVVCWLAGLLWILNPLWPKVSVFGQKDMDADMGIMGVLGWFFTEEWSYGLAVAGYAGVFLFLQWLFLAPRRNWSMRLADTGRPAWQSILAAAGMAGLLSTGLLATLLELPNWWEAWAFEEARLADMEPRYWPPLVALAVLWGVWMVVFAVYWRQGDRYTQLGRMIRGLIAGSILELLVATPVHVWASEERECYCARGSYTGLVLGGTVLLWAFGPGVVLLLLRERYRREKLLKDKGNSPGPAAAHEQ